jgi:hypothetical protein
VEAKDGGIRVYDETDSSLVSGILYENGLSVYEVSFCKVGLEEYYLRTMSRNTEGI